MASSDTPIGRHLHEIVSSLSGVEYDIVIPPLGMPLGEPLPVACAAGGIALACALRPPGAGEVTPEEAGVILLKLDGCGTSVCLQDETLRGTNHFRLALHRCLQGDHLTSEDGYSPNNGLDYFSSSSAGAGEPRHSPRAGSSSLATGAAHASIRSLTPRGKGWRRLCRACLSSACSRAASLGPPTKPRRLPPPTATTRRRSPTGCQGSSR